MIIRSGALGDVLLTRRLSYSLSLQGFRSTLFAPARHAFLLEADPWIDRALDAESPVFAGAFAGEWPSEHPRFDVAVVISASADLVSAARLAAAKAIQLPAIPRDPNRSIALQWAEGANELSPACIGSLPPLPTIAEMAVASDATLIHPGSGAPQKNWPLERFVELGLSLGRAGHRVIWVRGPAEASPEAASIPLEILDQPRLEALAATLALSRLFIGNDSGVSHLAAAVGAPTVAIFGLTSNVVWKPDGPRVATVRAASGDLKAINVESVLAAISTLTETGHAAD
ncbi:MAG: glycosyltransferase family 9 protein [Vicinamibacteria bacterium]